MTQDWVHSGISVWSRSCPPLSSSSGRHRRVYGWSSQYSQHDYYLSSACLSGFLFDVVHTGCRVYLPCLLQFSTEWLNRGILDVQSLDYITGNLNPVVISASNSLSRLTVNTTTAQLVSSIQTKPGYPFSAQKTNHPLIMLNARMAGSYRR